jgi:hypothetical protein
MMMMMCFVCVMLMLMLSSSGRTKELGVLARGVHTPASSEVEAEPRRKTKRSPLPLVLFNHASLFDSTIPIRPVKE